MLPLHRCDGVVCWDGGESDGDRSLLIISRSANRSGRTVAGPVGGLVVHDEEGARARNVGRDGLAPQRRRRRWRRRLACPRPLPLLLMLLERRQRQRRRQRRVQGSSGVHLIAMGGGGGGERLDARGGGGGGDRAAPTPQPSPSGPPSLGDPSHRPCDCWPRPTPCPPPWARSG